MTIDLTEINKAIRQSKREYGTSALSELETKKNPFEQFIVWLSDALKSGFDDPCAMTLATADEKNKSDLRIVLLSELVENGFIFYSGYTSAKAKQLAKNNVAALNFYWPHFSRQVRIKGRVEKISRQKTEDYFAKRPRESQLCVHAWEQDEIIKDRAEMEARIKRVTEQFQNKDTPCPASWGGYQLTPFEYEFFQGRDWRMHDRLLYTLQNDQWKMVRLGP